MSIKFIPAVVKTGTPTFGDVEENQFFVDKSGRLCQKYDHESYSIIAGAKGEPLCDQGLRINSSSAVERILPKIEKIEF